MSTLASGVLAAGPSWLDPEHLISSFGLAGIMVVIFAECGLLIGFFLPGDTLLFIAGLLTASQQYVTLPLWAVCALISGAAFLGNLVGYAIGYQAGPKVFTSSSSRLFNPAYVDRTRGFFDKYGALSVTLGRFVPIVRTFITVMAGVVRMPLRNYVLASLAGAVVWGSGITVLGYLIGNRIPFIRDHIELILLSVVVLAIVPAAIELLRSRRHGAPGAGDRSRADDASGSDDDASRAGTRS